MSEAINNSSKRKEALKAVIKRLHAGESVKALKDQFGEAIRGATAGEIAEAERALISEGVSVAEIQHLCDLHVAVFRDSLDEEPEPESLPGHPVFTFRMENEVTLRLLEAMANTLAEWMRTGEQERLDALRQQADNLTAIKKHYSRKENLLFPYLEKKGLEGPATVMWGVDNEIREKIKDFTTTLKKPKPDPQVTLDQFKDMAHQIQEMIYKEEKILFPEALDRLSEADWGEIREQEAEIGYFNVTPRNTWQPDSDQAQPKTDKKEKEKKTMNSEGLIPLSTGSLTLKQIDLMLTHLPVDITYVDENDEVRYFTRGRDRIFDRSPAIIGRAVTKCHPPQSVHRVQIILNDFRSGKRDLAEFWIQMGGKFIHIRYYALRDEKGAYQGCIEVTQDVTHIRSLNGERRLLDDAPDYE